MLRELSGHPEIYDRLESLGAQLTAWVPDGVTVNRVGSMFTFFFTDKVVTDWPGAASCDKDRFAKLFHFLLDHGVYIAPSQFEAGFISAAHTEADIAKTVAAMRAFFA